MKMYSVRSPTGGVFDRSPTGGVFVRSPTGGVFVRSPTGGVFVRSPTGGTCVLLIQHNQEHSNVLVYSVYCWHNQD